MLMFSPLGALPHTSFFQAISPIIYDNTNFDILIVMKKKTMWIFAYQLYSKENLFQFLPEFQ